MIDEHCGYHHNGYCLKGLSGTPCELRGCVAHTTDDVGYLKPQSSDELTRINEKLERKVLDALVIPDVPLNIITSPCQS